MDGRPTDVEGLRLLVVGASSGIGHAVAVSAAEQGAKVGVAARRMDLLTELAETIGGSAFELDVEDAPGINTVLGAAADALGGLDAVVFTSTVVPFAYIEDTDVATWLHAFTVNAVGANNVLRAAIPICPRTASSYRFEPRCRPPPGRSLRVQRKQSGFGRDPALVAQ